VPFLSALVAHLPSDPWFYAVGLVTTFLMAAAKGAFGGGLAIIGVPMLALVMDPISAAIVVAPLVAFMDLFALRAFPPSTWSRPDLRWLAPGLVAGLALGWLFFARVDPRIVVLVIALTTLAFTIRWFLRSRLAPPAPHGVLPGRAVALATMSGFTTFIAHAGGPPIAMYLLARGLDKAVYAGTTIAIFMLGNFLKLGPFLSLGLDRPQALAAALAFAPVVPLGVRAGKALHDRMDQQRLFFWCHMLLLAAGGKLLWDAVRAFG
jgi:uncharacterized protein